MCSFILACVATIGLTRAGRLQPHAVSLTTEEPILIDATQLMSKMEPKWGDVTIRCCCDIQGRGIFGKQFDFHTRSGRCTISTSETARNCPSVRPEWLAHKGSLHHFRKLDNPQCMVPEDEVHSFIQHHVHDYCSFFKGDNTFADVAGLGTTSVVQCSMGYKPVAEQVTCKWSSIQGGMFDPQPECTPDEEWCPTLEAPGYMFVQGTFLGHSSPVYCMPGFQPIPTEVSCTQHRTFDPQPSCTPISNFCQFQGTQLDDAPQVKPAAVHEQVPIQCSVGYKPSVDFTRCSESGVFEPTPFCVRDEQFCKEINTQPTPGQLISPGPHVKYASLNEELPVYCRKGWQASANYVKCLENGEFYPDPTCTKINNWCTEYTSEIGDVWVSYAGRSESKDVVCGHKNYMPAHKHVMCNENHEFEPTPKCILKPGMN